MNRSAFHNRLARATVAVALTVSAIGCATAPGSAPTPRTEVSSRAIERVARDPAPELADISLQSPIANPPEAVSASLAEPSPVWIDDTLARRSPLQQTELAVEPPPPQIDAPTPVAVATASPPVVDREDSTASQPASRDPRTESSPSDRTPDRSLALIEPRIPSRQRPTSPGSGPVPSAAPATAPSGSTNSGSRSPGATGLTTTIDPPSAASTTPGVSTTSRSAAIPRETATTDSVSDPTIRDNPVPVAQAPLAPAPVAAPNPGESTVLSSAPRSGSAANRPTTLWNERAAAVASGSEFSVVLPGSGWLYVGKEYGDGEIRLLGKSRSGGDEVFRFRIGEAGEYGLWFQQQDSLSGSLVNERLAVRAANDEEATSITLASLAEGSTLPSRTAPVSRATGGPAAPGGDAPTADRDSDSSLAAAGPTNEAGQGGEAADAVGVSDRAALDRALVLLDEGKPADALAAFVDGTERGIIDAEALDDDVLERFAGVARAPFDDDTARSAVVRSFWRRVASSGSAAAPEARRALLEIAARAGDAAEIATAVSALEAAGEASVDDMTRAAEALLVSGRESDALPLLGRALTRGGGALDSVRQLEDDRLFALARFLEQPGPERDLRSAASLYRLILDDRPLSMHWDDSRSRLEYLRRHYFEVR